MPRPLASRGAFRKLTAAYAALLSWLLVASVAILIVPVSLQIFSRFTALIPHYIWTEEMARFLFVWMVMIGANLGVREGTHFVVDLWPELPRRAGAVLRLISATFVLVFAVVFLWWGIEFTEFAVNRISELAELPLWMIHIAWPLTGVSWMLFLGEQMYDDARLLAGASA